MELIYIIILHLVWTQSITYSTTVENKMDNILYNYLHHPKSFEHLISPEVYPDDSNSKIVSLAENPQYKYIPVYPKPDEASNLLNGKKDSRIFQLLNYNPGDIMNNLKNNQRINGEISDMQEYLIDYINKRLGYKLIYDIARLKRNIANSGEQNVILNDLLDFDKSDKRENQNSQQKITSSSIWSILNEEIKEPKESKKSPFKAWGGKRDYWKNIYCRKKCRSNNEDDTFLGYDSLNKRYKPTQQTSRAGNEEYTLIDEQNQSKKNAFKSWGGKRSMLNCYKTCIYDNDDVENNIVKENQLELEALYCHNLCNGVDEDKIKRTAFRAWGGKRDYHGNDCYEKCVSNNEINEEDTKYKKTKRSTSDIDVSTLLTTLLYDAVSFGISDPNTILYCHLPNRRPDLGMHVVKNVDTTHDFVSLYSYTLIPNTEFDCKPGDIEINAKNLNQYDNNNSNNWTCLYDEENLKKNQKLNIIIKLLNEYISNNNSAYINLLSDYSSLCRSDRNANIMIYPVYNLFQVSCSNKDEYIDVLVATFQIWKCANYNNIEKNKQDNVYENQFLTRYQKRDLYSKRKGYYNVLSEGRKLKQRSLNQSRIPKRYAFRSWGGKRATTQQHNKQQIKLNNYPFKAWGGKKK